MENKRRIELNMDALESVNGGNIGFNPDHQGTYTMLCGFSGSQFYGVKLDNIMDIIAFAATIPNPPEGEAEIISYAQSKGYI